MSIDYLLIKDISLNKKNPRKNDHAVDMVSKSIQEFGFSNPILIDKDNKIIAGHTRLKAAAKLGMEKVPTIKLEHLNEQQANALMIADNKLSELATWDEELLKSILEDVPSTIDVESLGFTLDEIEQLVGVSIPDNYNSGIEDEVPEKVESRCSFGQIYKLGNHRLMCGDSTKDNDVDLLMNGELADLVITDPPYNVNLNRGNRSDDLVVMNDNLDDEGFKSLLESVFNILFNKMKPCAPVYVFFAFGRSLPFIESFIKSGLFFHQVCVWVIQRNLFTRMDYHYRFEPVIYGWKQGSGGHNWYSDRKQSNVWEFDRAVANVLHPTSKPIDLVSYPLLNSSKVNDLVLDLFGGSGSTLIACEKNNRRCYMMELDPNYCDVIITRWEEVTGMKAELIS